MNRLITRRKYLRAAAAASVAVLLPRSGRRADAAEPSQPSDHYATGTTSAATSTSRESTDAALWALREGGNAADAYMAAALTQTVCEPGLTSLAGGFGVQYFDAERGETKATVGRLGPAEAESYDFDRHSPVTQTGRAMPVPGFVAGVHLASRKFGKLPWTRLFEPAIEHATNGVVIHPRIIESAKRKGTVRPEGKALWIKDGQFLRPGEKLVQTKLGELLAAVAADGPAAFYEGEFARHYISRARADGGKITAEDMRRFEAVTIEKDLKPEGDYRGHQVLAAGLITYALHLNQALDLKASGPADKNRDSVFKQIRIMEEVFLSTKGYSEGNHSQFVDPDYARKQSNSVLNGPLREVTLDAIFNTCFLVVRDKDGNCAWGTHSINTPTAFGAGIVVDGVYAAHAMNREHVHGAGASAPGISTSLALFRDGKPRLIAGSPGFGFVHGPYQYASGIAEWDLSTAAAMNLPRFGLPGVDGKAVFERHYDPSVFEMLARKEIAHTKSPPTAANGLVGALWIANDGELQVVQDGRLSGFASAD